MGESLSKYNPQSYGYILIINKVVVWYDGGVNTCDWC